jgi:hypothetical protein
MVLEVAPVAVDLEDSAEVLQAAAVQVVIGKKFY